ncbi:hypothetical protein L198_01822 [Cryptococcus wingfieldii CBS 7118]|uniref:Zn(2)-C6 fungal-type domain-containing protein n=1 Tax=Cryptococcus wingfieldii CBS 7118 TaxID=1295528 RepID=A0A1E3JWA7_9TREE|nr:hypothetical protein L198_01822 [Cryptococcus wingfieldii CBS 7118]ODO05134.1 hypothetical protein L198_01822 [Cryptococcus wingfieldii CBS 7118]
MPPAPTRPPSGKTHVRAYQACQPCRIAKLKCNLGDPDAPHDPPCDRCHRSGRQCVFGKPYSRPKGLVRKKRESESVAKSPVASTSSATSRPSALDRIHSSTPLSRHPASDHGMSQDFRFVRGETLENPADALRILYAAAEYDASHERSESATSGEGPSQAGLWARWIPVRDGLLTAEEAALYKDHLNPCHPVVPNELFHSQNFSSLLSEPILLAALVSTAARYLDLGHSFDEKEPQRSNVIQGKLMNWVSSKIGLLSMGE